MKKVLLLIVILLIALACGFNSIAYAEQTTTANDYTDNFTYKFIEEFCKEYPNRQAGVTVNNPFYTDESGKPSLQLYLKNKIVENSNEKIAESEVKTQEFSVNGFNKGYNIVARINKAGTDKQIIIGAHYDSEGQGANDNASGVAALLIVLQQLSADVSKLPCNVVFVLFDGEELGFYGSYSYVSNMSNLEKDNTLVMINMDCIANGDNLYVWCENKHTYLADLFVGKSDKLSEKPYAKGTYYLINSASGYGYTEIPQNSDHTPFRLQGIPTALFFSGTYSADPWNYSESTNSDKNTMNTSVDTFDHLDQYNKQEFVVKVETTADVIVKTVLDDDFVETATNQRNQLVDYKVWGNALWAQIICGGILAIVIILAVTYYRKLQKRAILGTAEIKNNKVFSTPDAKDIFTFEEKKTDVEDVFSFDDKK